MGWQHVAQEWFLRHLKQEVSHLTELGQTLLVTLQVILCDDDETLSPPREKLFLLYPEEAAVEGEGRGLADGAVVLPLRTDQYRTGHWTDVRQCYTMLDSATQCYTVLHCADWLQAPAPVIA